MKFLGDEDWRLMGQDKYLFGATFEFRKYEPHRIDWDHDHCEFCWAKFCANQGEGWFHEGFVTEDKKHWVCNDCYKHFRDRFRFNTMDHLHYFEAKTKDN